MNHNPYSHINDILKYFFLFEMVEIVLFHA